MRDLPGQRATAVPAVDRTVAVIEYCAARPGAQFTLSELCRALDISKATAFGLLTALCEHGWLARDATTKTYRIGPGLAVLADALSVPHRTLIDAAQTQLDALATATGIRTVAATLVGDEIVILAVGGQERPLGTALRPGHRLRVVPPIGVVYMAWSGAEERERWLGRGHGVIGPDGIERLRAEVEAVRDRGFQVSLHSSDVRRLAEAMGRGEATPDLIDHIDAAEYVVPDLDPDGKYYPNMVSVPVLDGQERLAMTLTYFDFPAPLVGSEIVRLANRLKRAAAAVRKALADPR
ncbi:IclR family transcriptional regulator [Cryptosporangium minutisporangium]|uniref:IclR family transcriptional regulator n=1 Tax=Cryptosporangium minutisporangium TaxID=113569 RepID=A0ABP6SQX7_9ACTN